MALVCTVSILIQLVAFDFDQFKCRPLTEKGVIIACYRLQDYRLVMNFKFPCCLCASEEIGIEYSECAIYNPREGQYANIWVAGCATDRCGFIGPSNTTFQIHSISDFLAVNMERFSKLKGLKKMRYPLRGEYSSYCPRVPRVLLIAWL